jgi:polyhydroxybutyrate depolymerase
MPKRRKTILVFFALCTLSLTAALFWGIGPTLSCFVPGNDDPQSGMNVLRIESGGRQRCSLLYLPPDFDQGRSLSLILSLHGFASNPHGQRAFSQWDTVAAQEYAAVLYPQGTGFPQQWNADSGFGFRGVDDVQFIRDLINQVADQLPIDRKRIYVTGFSNGGAMTLRLACELSDSIAAVASVAAPVSSSLLTCDPDRPIPLLAFHGTEDQIVPYQGRSAKDWQMGAIADHLPTPSLYAAPDWVSRWAEGYSCNPDARPLPQTGNVGGLAYTECQAGTEILFYTVEGGGHTWPGGGRIPFVGLTTDDIFASEVMWAFFQEHPLP